MPYMGVVMSVMNVTIFESTMSYDNENRILESMLLHEHSLLWVEKHNIDVSPRYQIYPCSVNL